MQSQVTDQTFKGIVVGALAYILNHWNVDPAVIAVAVPAAFGFLAQISKMVGLKGVANFFAKEAL